MSNPFETMPFVFHFQMYAHESVPDLVMSMTGTITPHTGGHTCDGEWLEYAANRVSKVILGREMEGSEQYAFRPGDGDVHKVMVRAYAPFRREEVKVQAVSDMLDDLPMGSESEVLFMRLHPDDTLEMVDPAGDEKLMHANDVWKPGNVPPDV